MKYIAPKKNPAQGHHTETRDGFIPHIDLVFGNGIKLHAPVKLLPPRKGEFLPRPMKRNGKLVFALPGGLEHAL